jgi:hypothetical protein
MSSHPRQTKRQTQYRSHVTDRRQSKRIEKFERKFLGGVSGETQSLTISDERALKDAIQAVRSDTSDVNWALAAFAGSSKKLALEVVGTGSGGVDELKEKLKVRSARDDGLVYAKNKNFGNFVQFLPFNL